MTDEEFAEWLWDEMSQRMLTIKEFAEVTTLNPVTLRHYLHAMRSPTMSYVKIILDALGKKLVIVDKEEK